MPSRIMLNFDLNQEALKEFYNGTPSNAYSEIKTFLELHGFSWQQGSGYVSDCPMDNKKLYKLSFLMAYEMPWLSNCTSVFSASIFDFKSKLEDVTPKMNAIREVVSKGFIC